MFDEKINELLDRNTIVETMIHYIQTIEKDIKNIKEKKGIFVYGKNGIGKSEFVNYCIQHMNYCKVEYNGFDTRNSAMIENLKNNNVSNYNVLSMFNKKRMKNIIVMDDVEIMNKGDKGGINSLVKLIRPKKTKKQKNEFQINQPLICICDEKLDKKLNELKKNCYSIHLQSPTNEQIIKILKYKNIDITNSKLFNIETKNKILTFIHNNIYKLFECIDIYSWDKVKYISIINENIKNSEKEIIKDITKNIYTNTYSIETYTNTINETDKTSLSLVLHENLHLVFEIFKKVMNMDKKYVDEIEIIDKYNTLLDKYSYIDYYDRIIFQKQIWILNDLTSLLKIFYINNFTQCIYNTLQKHNLHLSFIETIQKSEILFTKVLTKYTSEYNNKLFFNYLNTFFYIDNKDIIYIFLYLYTQNCDVYMLKETNIDDKTLDKVIETLISCQYPIVSNLTKLDIKRIFKFIDKLYIHIEY